MGRTRRSSSQGKVTRKGKKNRKHGRNKVKCERYRREGRREKNKKRRQLKNTKFIAKKKAKREKEAE